MDAGQTLHIDLDGAWPRDLPFLAEPIEAKSLGERLRYSATGRAMHEFAELVASHPAKFTLYGSGDFHHLTSVLLQRPAEPFTLVSFDNHPDWDIRPPRWGCGTWINRALERPELERAVIWGCGNFELNWPTRLFANHAALRSGRLQVRPWEERLAPSASHRWQTVSQDGWRAEWKSFAAQLAGCRVYVTVDLDCLGKAEAATNWENGLFTAREVAWALGELHRTSNVIGGDLCGAYSRPAYARWTQRLASEFDHPKAEPTDLATAQRLNLVALKTIWPALTQGNERDTGGDEADAQPELRSGALL